MKSPILSCVTVLTLSLGALRAAYANSATWNLNPTSGDWNTAANWTPPTVPNGRADIASFDVSNTPGVSLSASAEVNEILFNPGASAYTVTATTRSGLTLSGVGITNNSGVTQNFATTSFEGDQSIGVITFTGTASAGENTVFTNNDGTAVVFDVGTTVFRDNSSAGHATIINRGGTAPGRFGGETDLFDSATGADSTIIVNGAEVAGADGAILFITGNAGKASIILNDGVGGNGGVLVFDQGTHGSTARIEVFGNGIVDQSSVFGGVSVGSIEGDGTILLGDFTLTVGTNNLSTVFSGLIKDGPSEGFGGSLRKIGTGVLTLSGPNKYTGATIVDEGGLAVENSEGSATGPTHVFVKGGTLSGTGTILGAVTVGTGSGSGAILDPGSSGTIPGTLTIQNPLILHADATCTVVINSDTPASDQVTARGVRIRNASVLFQDVGTAILPPGTTFTIINNIGARRIKGTFSNLADGSTITVGNNTFRANYEGGDGNDLTLTVVP